VRQGLYLSEDDTRRTRCANQGPEAFDDDLRCRLPLGRSDVRQAARKVFGNFYDQIVHDLIPFCLTPRSYAQPGRCTRSASTDEIACWFIDTDYNGEIFFVRHAYFTGADEPCDKLKRALRTEIDEVAWSSLYRTVSRPFDQFESGKIAVKVINHYGDEVLKVFEI
jgi:hypothetical protein